MKTKKQKIANGILVAVMLVLSLFFLFPVIWMIANSFKPDAAITADMNSVSAFIPPAPGKGFFDNYKEILFNTRFLRFMANTLFYAAIMIVAGVIVNGLAGYALAKIKFPFRDRWLAIIMMLMIIPTETIITINFMFVSKMGLLNTVFGYVLPMIVNPFNIFLFRQVFVSLPDDVWEAAQLDHCNPVKYFFTMAVTGVHVQRSSDRSDRFELYHIQRQYNHGTDACCHHPDYHSGYYHLCPFLQADCRGCCFHRFQGGLTYELY